MGVEGRESGRTVGEFELKFPGVCGREFGVEGRVICEDLVIVVVVRSFEVVVAGDGRLLEGVEPRDGVVRVDGVDDLVAVVEERLVGVDGLM